MLWKEKGVKSCNQYWLKHISYNISRKTATTKCINEFFKRKTIPSSHSNLLPCKIMIISQFNYKTDNNMTYPISTPIKMNNNEILEEI